MSDNYRKQIMGIRIEDSLPEEPEWYPCVALDSLSQPVLDMPLAWLKQDEYKVWVRPNLNIPEEAYRKDGEVPDLLGYLGYLEGNELGVVKVLMKEIDPVWNVKGDREFLLYDFEGKNCYEWPWSGIFIDFTNYPGYNDYISPKGEMVVTQISTKNIIYGEGQKRSVRSYTLQHFENGWGTLCVLEGIYYDESYYSTTGISDTHIDSTPPMCMIFTVIRSAQPFPAPFISVTVRNSWQSKGGAIRVSGNNRIKVMKK